MKLHLSTATGHLVTGTGDDWIRVGATEYRESLVLTPTTVETGWAPGGFEGLTASDFEALLAARPELVVLGTGRRMRFPHPRLTRSLTEAGVGVEAMDTRAACRTFNILAAEGRQVLAALLVEAGTAPD